jgi:hypothetical protein
MDLVGDFLDAIDLVHAMQQRDHGGDLIVGSNMRKRRMLMSAPDGLSRSLS